MYKPTWQSEWVETPARLQEIAALFAAEELITLDTETAGWQTGNERLCLVQVGIPSTQKVYLIDPLVIGDLEPLRAALENDKPEVIAHNASFEERQLGRHNIRIRGIIDTLPLSRKLRPDLPNHTLKTCAKLLVGFDMSKAQQTSDWSARPLSPEQLHYAALDAEIVFEVYGQLMALQSRLEISPTLEVPGLMADLAEVMRQRVRLTSNIATELAYLEARENLIRENIKARLVNGAPKYDGELGTASVTRVKRTEINPVRVREVFPSLADQVITEHVERERLKLVLKEHGLEESELQKVLDITGYNDRLNISLNDVV